jgi:hypothetical protein
VGISWRKHSRKPLNFYKKLVERRPCEEIGKQDFAEEPEYYSRKKKCAKFSKEATPKVTKEEPIPRKLEEEHIKSRTTPSVDFAESNETNKRSMSSAKPLREFEQMDWVPIDYGEVFDKRRPFPNQKGMADGKSVGSGFSTGKESRRFIRP